MIGQTSLDAMTDAIVPANIKSPRRWPCRRRSAKSRRWRRSAAIAEQNQVFRSFIGQGYYGTHTPNVILRNILENPAWYTAYTPYQAEISQGRMEALINFQTMVADLTGMEIANASLLDEATAAAEAMTLAKRSCKSQVEPVLRFRRLPPADPRGAAHARRAAGHRACVVGDDADGSEHRLPSACCCSTRTASAKSATTQALADAVHARGGLVAVAADLLALTLLTPPGEWGADIVVGNSQRFGVPFGFGGPHAAFMACRTPSSARCPAA